MQEEQEKVDESEERWKKEEEGKGERGRETHNVVFCHSVATHQKPPIFASVRYLGQSQMSSQAHGRCTKYLIIKSYKFLKEHMREEILCWPFV